MLLKDAFQRLSGISIKTYIAAEHELSTETSGPGFDRSHEARQERGRVGPRGH